MSQNVPKSKENGVKAEKSPGKPACPPHPHAHPHGDEGSESGSDAPPVPENIHKRVNALKHIHVEVQKIEQEMYERLFRVESEQHEKMKTLLEKRAQIISGKYEPTAAESDFKLKPDEEQQATGDSNGEAGIPEFWATIFQRSSQVAMLLNEEDTEALKYLVDVRSVYTEKPLGFKLEFEFRENPFFTNTVLTRQYEFGQESGIEELYLASGLAPKTTSGCDIKWKEGKNCTKKENITFQRNKKTGERRQIKKFEDQDSFFTFFTPSVTDLASLGKVVDEADDAAQDAIAEKAEQAEADFELASYLRTRVIPRALLLFTGDDDDLSYAGEDDEFDEEDDEDDEDEHEMGESGEESDESAEAGKKGPGAQKIVKVGKGPARR